MKKLLISTAMLAVSAGAVMAQTETSAPSVLERVLNNVNGAVGATTMGEGDVASVLSNIAATQTTLIENVNDGNVDVDQIFGNIDASVSVIFETVNQPLLSASSSAGAFDATTLNAVTSVALQEMKGTLGDVTTLTLGASLDAAASITGGANQTLNESEALAGSGSGGDAAALAQTTAQEAVVASNLALNTVDLASQVALSATDYNLDASAISTTAIGAVGGGSIVNGEIDKLNSAIFSVVGSTN